MEQLLCTPQDAAEVLNVSRSKIYDLLRLRELPSVKIGRSRRIPTDALLRYIEDLDDPEVG